MQTWEIDIKLDQIETDLLDVYIKIREAEYLIRGPLGVPGGMTEVLARGNLLDRVKYLRGIHG